MVAMPMERGGAQAATGDRSIRARVTILALVGFVAMASVASLGTGAAGVSLTEVFGKWITGEALSVRERVVLFDIRLPHLLTGLLVGASLAVSGAVMQGLFRNPLADPGIVGVGAGAGLGSLAGASWAKLSAAAPIMVLALVAAPLLARALNGLALGEGAAAHLGVAVQRMKNLGILTVAAATGAAVAVSGGIGFIGIVVPHLLRLVMGPDHRFLLPAAALLGAGLLLLADIISRLIIAPAELPIGIVTAVLGGPIFLWILLRRRGIVDMRGRDAGCTRDFRKPWAQPRTG